MKRKSLFVECLRMHQCECRIWSTRMYAWRTNVNKKNGKKLMKSRIYLQLPPTDAFHSTCWSRSNDLWVMSPTRFLCAKVLDIASQDTSTFQHFGMACPTSNNSCCLRFHMIYKPVAFLVILQRLHYRHFVGYQQGAIS